MNLWKKLYTFSIIVILKNNWINSGRRALMAAISWNNYNRNTDLIFFFLDKNIYGLNEIAYFSIIKFKI